MAGIVLSHFRAICATVRDVVLLLPAFTEQSQQRSGEENAGISQDLRQRGSTFGQWPGFQDKLKRLLREPDSLFSVVEMDTHGVVSRELADVLNACGRRRGPQGLKERPAWFVVVDPGNRNQELVAATPTELVCKRQPV